MTHRRRVLVTGAATGMGAQVVQRLRAQGDIVLGLDVVDHVDAVDHFFQVDLGDPASIRAAVPAIGEIDALVHVAGIPGDVAAADVVFAVNFLGLRELTEALLPAIADGGSITSVSSIAAHRWRERTAALRELLQADGFEAGAAWFHRVGAGLGRPVYALSKEAVGAYTEYLSARLRPRGIRVNAVAPGLTDTRLLSHFTGGMSAEVRAEMDRFSGGALPAEAVAAVLRMLLDEESRWINGQTIVVDGGYLAAVGAKELAA